MLAFIPFLLIIPMTYNIVYFFKTWEKLATKYKDPNHNEEFTVKGIGEEYEKEFKLLKIRFLVMEALLLLILYLSLMAAD
jgi:hypothetical protein